MKKTSKKSAARTATPWWKKLEALGACDGAVQWAKRFPSLLAAWRACERADWMLWLLGRTSGGRAWSDERKPVVRLACAVARTALQYVNPGEDRPRIAIETVEAWCDGKATKEQVQEARFAAAAAAYAAPGDGVRDPDAAYAAAYAAADAAAAAYAAADATDAAYAAADAADAYAAADAADWRTARSRALKEQCAIVRRHFPKPPKLVAQ